MVTTSIPRASIRPKTLAATLLAVLLFGAPSSSQAYYWFSGSYRPILNADPGTFYVGDNLSRAAGTGGWGGYRWGFGWGFGLGLGLGLGGRSYYGFGRVSGPSYGQYKAVQRRAEQLLAERFQNYVAQQNPRSDAAVEIRRQEREYENFAKTEGAVILRLDKKDSPEKTPAVPKESVSSKDGLVTVNYY